MDKHFVDYAVTLYEKFDRIDANEWGRVVDRGDLAMDLRLLGAFQRTLAGQCRCWGAIVRDQSGMAVAAAALARFDVDALETTGPGVQAVTRRVRSVHRGFMRFGVLFCGLPVPSGEHHVRVRPTADVAAVLGALNAAMLKLAGRVGARLVVWKEFETDSPCARELARMGYAAGEVPPEHRLEASFESFPRYRDAMKSEYRKQITRSERLFAGAGLRAVHLRGERIVAAFTDEVHRLYRAVWERSKFRLEFLPVEFFRETARAMGEQATLSLLLAHGERPVAFTFGLTSGRTHYSLYVGLDYELNAQVDLYFNLYYLDLDLAFRRGIRVFHMGQTSDAFKARLGAVQRTLYAYVYAPNPVVQLGLKKLARWAFPPVPHVAEHEVFKREQQGNGRAPERKVKSAAGGA